MGLYMAHVRNSMRGQVVHANTEQLRKLMRSNLKYSMAISAVLVLSVVALGQTPVPIVIDTNEIINQSNSWIETFTPILSIGFGISIALALITLVGTAIVMAIRGAMRGG